MKLFILIAALLLQTPSSQGAPRICYREGDHFGNLRANRRSRSCHGDDGSASLKR
jgi:hypothetical protein